MVRSCQRSRALALGLARTQDCCPPRFAALRALVASLQPLIEGGRMCKLLITFGVCSVAAMASAAAASAAPPERFHFTESGTEVLLHCDGFDGNLDTTGVFDGTAFFD